MNAKDYIALAIYVIVAFFGIAIGMSGAEQISIWRILIGASVVIGIHCLYDYLGIFRYIGNKIKDEQ